jgi:hypothetical protein
MPKMNGFELSEKILAIDINVRVCFMSFCRNKPRGAKRDISSFMLGMLYQKTSNYRLLG